MKKYVFSYGIIFQVFDITLFEDFDGSSITIVKI